MGYERAGPQVEAKFSLFSKALLLFRPDVVTTILCVRTFPSLH